jgi:hypothetical protein
MKTLKTFKDFFNFDYKEIIESLNSPVNFYKETIEGDYKFFYFKINDKEFRIVIEEQEDESAIIFEQKIDNDYTYEGFQNNLSKQESLSLFSTLKTITDKIKTPKNYIYTDSKKKLRLYLKILKSMPEIEYINYFEETVPYMIGFTTNKNVKTNLDSKFKFKFWK